MDNLDAYCSMCGSVSHIIKENSKGQIFLPIDKIVPTGVTLIISGIVANMVGYLIYQRIIPILFGLGFAIVIVGVVLVKTRKKAIEFGQKHTSTLNNNKSTEICRFCYKELISDGKYCPFCGSKRKS